MIKNSHRDSIGYFPLLMSVCGQLGTGAGSLLAGPPVHRARPLSGPRSESCHFCNGDGNWSEPVLASRRTGNALKYKWGWIFIFLLLSFSPPDSIKVLSINIHVSQIRKPLGTRRQRLPINASLASFAIILRFFLSPKLGSPSPLRIAHWNLSLL